MLLKILWNFQENLEKFFKEPMEFASNFKEILKRNFRKTDEILEKLNCN